jgi:hypothetical protein
MTFSFKRQKAARGPDIQQRLATDIDVSDVFVEFAT